MPPRTFYQPVDFKHIEAIFAVDTPIDSSLAAEFERFRQLHLPPLVDLASLPRAMGISEQLVFGIIAHRRKHYRVFEIPRKNRDPRTIHAPRTYLKVIQWWILDNILRHRPHPAYVFGFVSGRSAVDNARHHFGSRHLLNIDIQNFFPSISVDAVRSTFSKMGYSDQVAVQLADLCTYRNRLVQGAPTSPALANEVCREMDETLKVLADGYGLRYSRYADDLTFSGKDKIAPGLAKEVTAILGVHKFKINRSKLRFAGGGDRMEVTGFVINDKIHLPIRWRHKVRAIFHYAKNHPGEYENRRDLLNGYVGVIRMYDTKGTSKLLRLGLEAIEAVAASSPR